MDAATLNHRAVGALQAGRAAEASALLRRALLLDPADADVLTNLGIAREELGDAEAAEVAFRRALRFAPAHIEARSNLGNLLRVTGAVDEASSCFSRILASCPHDTYARRGLARVKTEQGHVTEAVEHYRRVPGHEAASDALWLSLHLELPALHLSRLHREWGYAFADHLARPRRPRRRKHRRRIHIGYVSPNFRDHTVARFLEPVLEHHDRRRFAVHCYSDVRRPDGTTRRLQGLVDTWRDTLSLSDAELADRVAADEIDVLIDLTGHMGNGRLLTFARAPAPVQIGYIGYPYTSGMRAMTHRVTDGICDPPGAEGGGTERLLRLERCAWAYKPPDAPEVPPLPADVEGRVTFGSLNRPSKITETVALDWARVLDAVPDSRLLALVPGGERNASIRRLLSDAGIAPERLEIVPTRHQSGYLELCGRVDIALDPFPYNGMTTTCDLLWMGVPVVTLCGEIHVSRVGASLLRMVGLSSLVASSRDQYVELAANLAHDRARLRRLRRELRAKMAHGGLLDGQHVTCQLEGQVFSALSEG